MAKHDIEMTCPVCNGNEFLGEGATFSNEGGPADDPPPKCTNCDGSGLAPGIILKNGDVARTGDTLESKGVKYLLEFYKFDSAAIKYP